MLVPYYANKKDFKKTYKNNDYKRINFNIFINILTPELMKDFENINGFDQNEFTSSDFLEKCKKYPPVNIWWDNFVAFKDFFLSAKMLIMTWFTCKYWYWKKWELNKSSSWKLFTHHGVDIILPKWTPILSFSDWLVVRSEFASAYWNCVVVKSNIEWETLYFCYEHLESLTVSKWESVSMSDKLWTCWDTWNSVWYHLHFQIDRDTAKFHPYWSSWKDDVAETLKNCIDPIEFLRNRKIETPKETQKQDIKTNDFQVWGSDFVWSMIKQLESTNKATWDYISFFKNAWILKWDAWKFYLNNNLTRYQMTLIIYRLYKAWLVQINDFNSCSFSFDDISNDIRKDWEFMDALNFVVCTNILNWDNWHFLPWNKLTWEQFLAIIWRLFANLKDSEDLWYKNYMDWAVDISLIEKDWIFIGKYISRKQVFSILYKLLSD